MTWRNAGFVALGALCLAALIFAAGMLLVASSVPPSLAGPVSSITTPVSEQEFADPLAVAVAITEVPPISVSTRASGTITAATCEVGARMTSGDSTFSVNGVRLTTIATDEPLWRPLKAGDQGDDVSVLQKELVRLGEEVSIDGVFGEHTGKAAAEVIPALEDADHFDPALVLWIPAPEVEVLRCPVHRGEEVAAGDSLVEIKGGGAEVVVSGVSSDALPGERELVIDDLVVPLSSDGGIDDSEFRSAVLDTDAYRGAKGDAAVTKVPGTVRLRTPVKVASVPPSAILQGEDGSATCVADGTATIPVRIVGSELGQTFVMFDDGPPPVDVLTAPDERSAVCT